MPEGFSVSVYAADVENARQMAQAPDGTVFVGSRKAGQVWALRDSDGDGKADQRWQIADSLTLPSGVAYRNGTLYVAAVSRILAWPAILDHLAAPPAPQVRYADFPTDTHHGWKYLDFLPNGELIVPVGAPCNICDPALPYASIQALDLSTGSLRTLALGVRNSVGFALRPGNNELWFTDNGRDWLGDSHPADELNRLVKAGDHFGYPYIHGGDTPDPEFGKGKSPADYRKPALLIPAHHAPLGMTFYTGNQFPAAYRGDIFIAEHGSWNRSERAGYRVTRVRLSPDGEVTDYQPFVSGWLHESLLGGKYWGRPADVMVSADGSLLISDDSANAIYRVRWQGTK
ncbi:PQQ-dependent sugar dehydrogenase [Alcanivorax hongdengensis]|uniref:PQQ-dependent sugar dehydrogenase n=1 Tax=Alcanivorax hongdengensis TaxID=519051 RepID=UPI003F978D90